MKYLFAILISLMSVTPTSASDRIYATGCIPSTPEDWERVGVPLRSPSEELRASRLARLSCDSIGLLSIPLTNSKPVLPRYEIPTMSDVKNQSPLGTCSIFAIVAAIEAQLPKGTIISEAELFTRVKTIVAARLQEGVALSSYIPLLRDGVVLNHQYVDYDFFAYYVLNIIKNKREVTISSNHGESVRHLKTCATEHGKAPREFHPTWNEAVGTVHESIIPGTEPMNVTLRNAGWGGLLNLFPGSGLLNQLTREVIRTQYNIDPNSYMPLPGLKVSVIITNQSQANESQRDRLIEDIKQSICNNVPVVVDVKTFAKFERDTTGKGDHIIVDGKYISANQGEGVYKKVSQWLFDSLKENREFIVDTNIKAGYDDERAHAICICGYDNAYQPDKLKPAVSAFKFKNSWGERYGNQGYGWLTEAYVRQYTYNALVLDINGRQ